MSKLKEPFVIVIKNDDDCDIPDAEVTIKAADPLDAVELAGRIIDLFKCKFIGIPIVEIQPLKDDEQ